MYANKTHDQSSRGSCRERKLYGRGYGGSELQGAGTIATGRGSYGGRATGGGELQGEGNYMGGELQGVGMYGVIMLTFLLQYHIEGLLSTDLLIHH